MEAGDQLTLSCSVESYPPPTYLWVQYLSTGEVLVLGHQAMLVIQHITFAHIGQYVCRAHNYIRGEKISKESDGIDVSVQGPPYIKDDRAIKDIEMSSGENIEIKIPFCSFPPPKSYWVFSIPGSDN